MHFMALVSTGKQKCGKLHFCLQFLLVIKNVQNAFFTSVCTGKQKMCKKCIFPFLIVNNSNTAYNIVHKKDMFCLCILLILPENLVSLLVDRIFSNRIIFFLLI